MDKEKSARLSALSAAIPHISFEYQKKLAVMVKLMEIKDICRYYDMAESNVKTPQDPNWRQNLINAILPHFSEKKQANLKTIAQALEIQEMMANYENFKELFEWK